MIPFDIIALIVDIVGENNDTNLLKELALVSHSFLQVCRKHLFATVELYPAAYPTRSDASLKKGFVKLLESRPDVVKYIRKLKYKVDYTNNDDRLLSPILLKILPTFSRLNSLRISGSLAELDWNKLDSSLTSAFLHFMRLPTINHIDLSNIQNFPLSSLTPSVNLHRLDISNVTRFCGPDSPEEDAVIVELMSKIREFHTSNSALLTTKLLYTKMQDGQPAFDLMDLRQLSMSFTQFEDERNIRYLLQNAKLLDKLRLSVKPDRNLVGLLSLSAHTLKVLDLRLYVYSVPPLAGLCEELEAMAGHNVLEALSLEVCADVHYRLTESKLQELESVLVKPGWSALRQISFKVLSNAVLRCSRSYFFDKSLQSLPDKYLSRLSKLESVAFNYSTSWDYY